MPDLVDGGITAVTVLVMLAAALWIARRDERRRHDRAVDARIRERYQRHG